MKSRNMPVGLRLLLGFCSILGAQALAPKAWAKDSSPNTQNNDQNEECQSAQDQDDKKKYCLCLIEQTKRLNGKMTQLKEDIKSREEQSADPEIGHTDTLGNYNKALMEKQIAELQRGVESLNDKFKACTDPLPQAQTAQTQEALSPELEEEFKKYEEFFQEQIVSNAKAGPLEVPYYSQANLPWCWAAAATMLQGYHGYLRKVWNTASECGGNSQGLADCLARSQPPGQGETKLFLKRPKALAGYLISQLDRGRPVWVTLYSADHAIVVVGYDKKNIYIHDSSGFVIQYFMSKIKEEAPPEFQKLENEPRLGAYSIPWHYWNRLTYEADKPWQSILSSVNPPIGPIGPNLGVPAIDVTWVKQQGVKLVGWIETLALQSPPPARKPLSVNLMPSSAGSSLVFSHEAKGGQGLVDFFWDNSRKEGTGTKFVHNVNGFKREWTVCNNDRLTDLKVFLSNTSASQRSVQLRAFIDEHYFAGLETALAAMKVHVPVDIPKDKIALDQRPFSFLPGKHEMVFRLYENGQIVDEAKIDFSIAPSQVSDVKLMPLETGKAEISWEAIPEEEKGFEPDYRIKQTYNQNLPSEGLPLGVEVACRNPHRPEKSDSPRRYSCEITLPGDENERKDSYYSVWACSKADADKGIPEICSLYADFRRLEAKASTLAVRVLEHVQKKEIPVPKPAEECKAEKYVCDIEKSAESFIPKPPPPPPKISDLSKLSYWFSVSGQWQQTISPGEDISLVLFGAIDNAEKEEQGKMVKLEEGKPLGFSVEAHFFAEGLDFQDKANPDNFCVLKLESKPKPPKRPAISRQPNSQAEALKLFGLPLRECRFKVNPQASKVSLQLMVVPYLIKNGGISREIQVASFDYERVGALWNFKGASPRSDWGVEAGDFGYIKGPLGSNCIPKDEKEGEGPTAEAIKKAMPGLGLARFRRLEEKLDSTIIGSCVDLIVGQEDKGKTSGGPAPQGP